MSSRKVIAKHTKMGKQSARSQTSSTSSSTKIHGNENLRKDGTGLNVIGRSLTPMLSEKKKKKTPKGTENDTGRSLVPIVKKKSRNKTPAEVTDGDVLLAPTSKKKTKKKLVLEKAVRETATETLLAQRSKKKKKLTIQTEAGKKEKNPFKLYPLAIQEQLEKGEKSWREEADAFDGVNFVDEVWDIKPRQLKKMAKAWDAAMARHGEISEALASWEPKDDEEHGAWIQATMHKTQIFSHFPYQFQTDFKIDLLKRVEKQEEASQLTNIQKADEIEKLQEASECESERCIFADIISSAGFDTVEDMEEIDPFYHKCLRDMTAIDIEELAQITTAVVSRAYKIRDYGGSHADIETAMAHIPAGFWPPNLVYDLQAWRHTERALLHEKVKDIKLKAEEILLAEDNIDEIISKTEDILLILEASSESVSSALSGTAAAATIASITSLNTLVGAYGSLKQALAENNGSMKKALQSLEREDFAQIVEGVLSLTASLQSVVANSSNSAAALNFVSVVPLLGAMSSGIHTGLLAKATIDIAKKRKETKKMAKRHASMVKEHLVEADEALTSALQNEIHGRSLQLAKQTIATVAGGVATVSSVLNAAGGSGVAIQFTSKGLEYGNKVAFALIKKKEADTAMETLADARAGSVKAQKKIFKDCAMYAKIYIYIKAKAGDSFCTELIKQRGITDDDLDKPMALLIVQKALLDDAGQVDEAELSEQGYFSIISSQFGGKDTAILFHSLVKKLESEKKVKNKKKQSEIQNLFVT